MDLTVDLANKGDIDLVYLISTSSDPDTYNPLCPKGNLSLLFSARRERYSLIKNLRGAIESRIPDSPLDVHKARPCEPPL
ncbi:hypothetical protein SCP_0704840 [Sparassis crispa]|uniref:Uncharacterized protein n=1 Tax=Sparassis crispa TaxID=139825 RepID=A0A401GSW0_9APHY|nr:hypothetical protein SCP_0704840 [Sparassis crispa]GBE85297.1 hypothetical protein SCP_0704840 [Sparassis crispa]